MTSKPRVTVEAVDLVWIDVCGAALPDGDGRVFDDGGLLDELRAWEIAQKIYELRTIRVGGGRYVAGYAPDDAKRVLAWLKEHGVRKRPSRR